MAKKVTPDKLGDVLNEIFADYQGDIIETVNEATKKVAEAGASELKQRAKFSGIKGRKYVNSFRADLLEQSRLGNVYVIRSTEYRLAHLLEHGHAIVVHDKRTGKRTKAYHHWSEVEQDVVKQYEQEIKAKIQQIRG